MTKTALLGGEYSAKVKKSSAFEKYFSHLIKNSILNNFEGPL